MISTAAEIHFANQCGSVAPRHCTAKSRSDIGDMLGKNTSAGEFTLVKTPVDSMEGTARCGL